jgi:hypothetical protein
VLGCRRNDAIRDRVIQPLPQMGDPVLAPHPLSAALSSTGKLRCLLRHCGIFFPARRRLNFGEAVNYFVVQSD